MNMMDSCNTLFKKASFLKISAQKFGNIQIFGKAYARFQPYQDITFRFMFQPLEIVFCQIKILSVQNASARLMATASTMVPMSL